MVSELDPIIFYCFVLPDDDPRTTSPFQGFSWGWRTLTWAMRRLVELPSDTLEPALPRHAVLARRIGGTAGWRWFPLAVKSLTELEIAIEAPFWVVFSGTQEVAQAVSAWGAKQLLQPLHVTPASWDGAITADELSADVIRIHVRATLERARSLQPSLAGDLVDEALSNWKARPQIEANFAKYEHNCTLPNHMALEGAGIVFARNRPLIGNTVELYTAKIVESSEAILALRRDVGDVPGFRLTPPQPSLILTAPSLFRHEYRSRLLPTRDMDADPQIVGKVIRLFQRQTGFHWTLDKEELDRVLSSKGARSVVQVRQDELEIHTLTVGLRGASTLAATIRLPPAVNRVSGAVRQLASHARAPELRRPEKFAKLFSAVQSRLRDAVGSDLLKLICASETGIKLVADAPLEWLPVGDLTLGLRFDTSRITSTPGNLMAGELVMPSLLRLKTTAFSNILIISSFAADDPIRRMIPDALDTMSEIWRDRLTIRSTEVQDEGGLRSALDSYDGGVLIFDGHGRHDDGLGAGTLVIGGRDIDVWSLRGRVRVPPVVILSACDTHAAERSHATTANAFLTLGARTVLATLLPIQAARAAIFVARLLVRLADFLPAALEARGRAIVWSEVIGGMLRMQLLTDLLRPLIQHKRLSQADYREIHTAGEVAINTLGPNWFEDVIRMVSKYSSIDEVQVRDDFRTLLPFSDTIRYIQVGNPETILVDSPSTARLVVAEVASREGS